METIPSYTDVIWGVSAGHHDASISVIQHNQIKFAAHSERYSKIKNDPNLHPDLITEALTHGEPDRIAWYERPVLKAWRKFKAGQFSSLFDGPFKHLDKRFHDRIIYVDHHLSHASGGYFTSGLNDATIVVIDGIGEIDCMSIWAAEGKTIKKIFSWKYPRSLGLFYSAVTAAVGLKPNEDEYILMGASANGNIESRIQDVIQRCFTSRTDSFKIANGKISLEDFKIRDLHKRDALEFSISSQKDMFDIAAAAQFIYEKFFIAIVEHAKSLTKSKNLILSGGCALNCVANSRLEQLKLFDTMWIMPNPGDAGSSLGAALYLAQKQVHFSPYLGKDIPGDLPFERILQELIINKVCGVARGRAEFGPRALGNRSLLADPRDSNIKSIVNRVKRRQDFRPFAPVILEEDAKDYFEEIETSPYMQGVYEVKHPKEFPAITHVDGTARVQTVNRNQNPWLYELLTKWKLLTGCPMLLNTSLNIKGYPLVNDIHDAIEFQSTFGIKVFFPK